MLKKSLWIILVFSIFTIFLYFGGAEKIMISYYANKTGQETEKIEEYFDKVEEYTQKIEEDVSNFDYHIELARAYEYAGKIDKAIEIYNKQADNVNDDIFYIYHNNLGGLYDKKGEHKLAIEHYIMIAEKFENQYPNIYLKIANTYLELNDKNKASEYYFKYRSISGSKDSAFELKAGINND